ncbi:MAG: hypothetical protein ACD_15C00195G0001 [uncultured bacterium]|nr:MAG: hypothetical protein ACD_15C00195G0001 [uncultured bacterium]HCU70507.1 pyruvate kinase [Candidatus Moranbacteria bacterium]
MKKTRIVATIGPASDSRETMKKLVESGVNVFRINFSHNTYDAHQVIIDNARELEREMKRPIGLLADLQGPRIRVGNAEAFEIEKGEIIFVSDKKSTEEKELIIDSDGVVAALQVGEKILIEDGLMRLLVVEKTENLVKAEVLNGGTIKPRKGMNLPDTKLSFGAVTQKDRNDLEFALRNEIDFVALSFVSNAREIEETREKIKEILGREKDLPQIIAKIERKEAIENIDEIIQATDVVMVARGDLGIEMDESKVVLYQKEIIAKCLRKAKIVIVATQMLDSMINNPIPTRAEVSDVSNAVIDHTDAVMLSGESASGKYPVEAVQTMAKIIRDTEDSPFDDIKPAYLDEVIYGDYDSIINSAHEMAKSCQAKAIVLFSESGFSARLVSHHRPTQLIIVGTHNLKTYNQMAMLWGARAYYFEKKEREEMIEEMVSINKKAGRLQSGDKAVVILGRTPGAKDIALIGIRIVE